MDVDLRLSNGVKKRKVEVREKFCLYSLPSTLLEAHVTSRGVLLTFTSF
jgi:hypothetical protein